MIYGGRTNRTLIFHVSKTTKPLTEFDTGGEKWWMDEAIKDVNMRREKFQIGELTRNTVASRRIRADCVFIFFSSSCPVAASSRCAVDTWQTVVTRLPIANTTSDTVRTTQRAYLTAWKCRFTICRERFSSIESNQLIAATLSGIECFVLGKDVLFDSICSAAPALIMRFRECRWISSKSLDRDE